MESDLLKNIGAAADAAAAKMQKVSSRMFVKAAYAKIDAPTGLKSMELIPMYDITKTLAQNLQRMRPIYIRVHTDKQEDMTREEKSVANKILRLWVDVKDRINHEIWRKSLQKEPESPPPVGRGAGSGSRRSPSPPPIPRRRPQPPPAPPAPAPAPAPAQAPARTSPDMPPAPRWAKGATDLFETDVKRMTRMSGNALLMYMTLGSDVMARLWSGRSVAVPPGGVLPPMSLTKADTYLLVKATLAADLFPDLTLQKLARVAGMYAQDDRLHQGLEFVQEHLYQHLRHQAQLHAQFLSRKDFTEYIAELRAKQKRKAPLSASEAQELKWDDEVVANVTTGGYANVLDFVHRLSAAALDKAKTVIDEDKQMVELNMTETLRQKQEAVAALERAEAEVQAARAERERVSREWGDVQVAIQLLHEETKQEAEELFHRGVEDKEHLSRVRQMQIDTLTGPVTQPIERDATIADRKLRLAELRVQAASLTEVAAQKRYEHADKQHREVELVEHTIQDVTNMFSPTKLVQYVKKLRFQAATERLRAREAAEAAVRLAKVAQEQAEQYERRLLVAPAPVELSLGRAAWATADHAAHDWDLTTRQVEVVRSRQRVARRREQRKTPLPWDRTQEKVDTRQSLRAKRLANTKAYAETSIARAKAFKEQRAKLERELQAADDRKMQLANLLKDGLQRHKTRLISQYKDKDDVRATNRITREELIAQLAALDEKGHQASRELTEVQARTKELRQELDELLLRKLNPRFTTTKSVLRPPKRR